MRCVRGYKRVCKREEVCVCVREVIACVQLCECEHMRPSAMCT